MMYFIKNIFFKQKTAYEIYQCDWSSDVCSSDLGRVDAADQLHVAEDARVAREVDRRAVRERQHEPRALADVGAVGRSVRVERVREREAHPTGLDGAALVRAQVGNLHALLAEPFVQLQQRHDLGRAR